MIKVNMIGIGNMFPKNPEMFNTNAVFDGGNDELIVVDAGGTHNLASIKAGIDYTKARKIHVIVTHPHADHDSIEYLIHLLHENRTHLGHQPIVPTVYVLPGQMKHFRERLHTPFNINGKTMMDYVHFEMVEDLLVRINHLTFEFISTEDLHCKGLLSYAFTVTDEAGDNILYTGDIARLQESGLKERVDAKTKAIFQDTSFGRKNAYHATLEEVLAYYEPSHHPLLRLMHLSDNFTAYQEEVKRSGAQFAEQGKWVIFGQ